MSFVLVFGIRHFMSSFPKKVYMYIQILVVRVSTVEGDVDCLTNHSLYPPLFTCIHTLSVIITKFIIIFLFVRAVRTARRRPTYSVKLRLWKISTFYFKIVAIPTPLTITNAVCSLVSALRRRCDRVRSEIGRCSAVSELQLYVKATACLRRRSTVTG